MPGVFDRLHARLPQWLSQERSPDAPYPVDALTRILPALQRHVEIYGKAVGAADLTGYEARVFSQNGEDGVIAEILARIGTGPRWFVEFGAGSGHEGNCVVLADAYAWSGLFGEADDRLFERLASKYVHNDRVRTARACITANNVESVFRAHSVPKDFDVLSIDIDGNDYWIWKAIVAFRPRLVVIEYNASLSTEEALVFPYDEDWVWDGTAFYGSSLGALCDLAKQKGYQLVHTDLCGVNAFFVRDDLAPSVGVANPPRRAPNFGLTGGRMPADPLDRSWQRVKVDDDHS
jgi:hypothetical protein